VTVSRATLRACAFAAFATTWELVARQVDGLLFPSFTDTLVALPRLLVQPGLWQAVWISHQAFLLGFGAAVVLGTGVGLLMGRAPAADAFLDPYLTILLATPMSALIPVIIMAIGLDLFARMLVVLLFSVVVIAVNVRTGLRTLDPAWLEMARSFGANERQIWRTVLVPGALPAVVTGLRLGLGRAFTGMVAVELLLVAAGVGRLLLEFQGRFDAGAVYALVLLLVVEAVLLLRGLSWVEGRLTPWAYGAATE
jgi:NitT/TauT family transport system permease protein